MTAGETATTTLTSQALVTERLDTIVITSSCSSNNGNACPSLQFYWTATADSNTNTALLATNGSAYAQNSTSFMESSVVTVNTLRAVVSAKAMFTPAASYAAGTYTYTIYSTKYATTERSAVGATATFTVTVTAPNTTIGSLNTYVGSVAASGSIAAAAAQASYWRDFSGATQSAKDSSAVLATTSADAATANVAAVIFGQALNSAGETITAGYTTTPANSINICASSACALTATMSGPGLLMTGLTSQAISAARKSVTWTIGNGNGAMSAGVLVAGEKPSGESGETLTVLADGTAGVGTLNIYNGTVLLKSITITFTGAPASAVSLSLSDSSVSAASGTTTFSAIVRDSGANVLNAGTVYVWASDTKVVSGGAGSSNATQNTQVAANTRPSSSQYAACTTVTSGRFSCTLTIGDTGTATVFLSDSWTAAASSWTSSAVTVTGISTAASLTIAFDKTSYTAGEAATITITATDLAGRAAISSPTWTVSSNYAFGNSGIGSGTAGLNQSGLATSSTFTQYVNGTVESGIETRVVTMPSNSGTLVYTIRMTPTSTNPTQGPVTYTATGPNGSAITITDPAEVAANAATAAAKAAQAAAVEATKAAQAAAVEATKAAQAAAVEA
ncbi:MAG: hypothetical protein EBU84_16605, partial [Actinobacteria bacterium]|nr:hypothetical protein [Actinomycetota bacterium]